MRLWAGAACWAAVATVACATTSDTAISGSSEEGFSSARVSTPPAALPQPVASGVGREARLTAAEQTLVTAFTVCNGALANPHLLPSEFFSAYTAYSNGRDQAMLQDSDLRESTTTWAPSGAAEGNTYEFWVVRCDMFFKSNEANFKVARATEDAARGQAPSAATPAEPELKERVVANEEAPHEDNPLLRHLIKTCTIEEGHIKSCAEAFTGEAPAFKDGVWRSCTVKDGVVMECGDAIQGAAIVKESGLIRSCDVVEGVPVACTDGWLGKAPVRAPQ